MASKKKKENVGLTDDQMKELAEAAKIAREKQRQSDIDNKEHIAAVQNQNKQLIDDRFNTFEASTVVGNSAILHPFSIDVIASFSVVSS